MEYPKKSDYKQKKYPKKSYPKKNIQISEKEDGTGRSLDEFAKIILQINVAPNKGRSGGRVNAVSGHVGATMVKNVECFPPTWHTPGAGWG